MKFTAQEIATIIKGTIEGNPNIQVNSISKIEEGTKGDISFLANKKYTNHIYTSNASIIIVNNSFEPKKKINATLIKVDDPYLSFKKIIEIYQNRKDNPIGVSKKSDISNKSSIKESVYIGAFTSISKETVIEKNVQIHPNCYIGKNVSIGENTIIFPNVTIYDNCKIGKNNIIHSGVVIGSDGFGFAPNKYNYYEKINQIGNVEVADNVEIGSNTTIDRATIGATKIGKGVKLDNLIQIGHNVEIGENTVIAAQTAIAGSSKIGKDCMIGGQVAISGHITITDKVKIAGQSGVASSITKKGSIVQGPMAFDIKKFQRSYIIFKKLPEIKRILESIKSQFDV